MWPSNQRVQLMPLCSDKTVAILKFSFGSIAFSTYRGGAAEARAVGPRHRCHSLWN